MKKILIFLAAICAIACTGGKTTIYDFTAESNAGEQVNFKDYKGKVLLVVNTASKCGFTPQYDGLEALYKKYKDQGFVVIGFPCDQFGHQEPGTNAEIEEFCRLNHGVTFPLMAKSDVNGENANAIFKWLYTEKPFAGFGDSDRGKFMDGMLARNDPDYASNQVPRGPQGQRRRPVRAGGHPGGPGGRDRRPPLAVILIRSSRRGSGCLTEVGAERIGVVSVGPADDAYRRRNGALGHPGELEGRQDPGHHRDAASTLLVSLQRRQFGAGNRPVGAGVALL